MRIDRQMSTLPKLGVVVINSLSGFGVEGTEHPDQLMTVGRSLLFRIPPCAPSLCKPRPIRIPPRRRTPPPPPRH